MAEFTRKPVPFVHKGMNWNVQADKLGDGEYQWCKNVRVIEQGTIFSMHGHTAAFSPVALNYLHSFSRLNIFSAAIDPALHVTYLLGADTELFVFPTDASLHGAQNPVKLPSGGTTGFSGNPLSIIDAQPVGATVAWKYIGDSAQMVTVGYYPGDSISSMARALTIGLRPPLSNVLWHRNSGGALNGNYNWEFAFRRVQTGARSNPSAAVRYSVSQPAITCANQSVTLQLPTAPIDPTTGVADVNVVVDVYRFGGTVNRWALVGSGAGGSNFTDNMPDIQLLTAPTLPQTVDPVTGLTRPNVYQPFVTQDIRHSGTGTVNQDATTMAWRVTWVSGDPFDLNWLAGSTMYVNGTAFTIYQVLSTTLIELAQDVPGVITSGSTYNWSIPAGTLRSGQPLPHLFGIYGVGQSASYVFACGDPNGPGTLYWSNGNDPDSTDLVNSIQVTSPSEKLMTGCVYDGQPYCWSTERFFQIFPSLTVFGQFTTQEVAGAKGCWLEWSHSVQSNGLSDQSVSWRGKDGIYDWSVGGGLRRLSDPLYPFFPHDNQVGFGPETIIDAINPSSQQPEHVGNLDDSQPKYHRLCWFQGVLFYDFVAQSTLGNTWSTLVWDDVQVHGWVSLDQPFADTVHSIARGIEIGANNLKVMWNQTIYDYFGNTRGFQSRVITRAEDCGDPRATKLFGDYWLDCTPLAVMSVYPMTNINRTWLTANTIPTSSLRQQVVLDFTDYVASNGIGLLAQTIGLDIRWTGPDGLYSSYLVAWQPSFIMKPERITFRISDRTDEGFVGAKYLMGANIEANTFNVALSVNVMVDGNLVSTLAMTHNGQTEFPYAWTPVAGYEFQVELKLPAGALWELFKIRWLFEPWPDAVVRTYPFMDLGTAGAKYIRQIVLPLETGGASGSVSVLGDDGLAARVYSGLTTPALQKEATPLAFATPMIAHEIQLATLSAIRIWPDQIKVDFEPWQELSIAPGPITNCGYDGAKFLQGLIVPVDTNNQPVTLKVTVDGSTIINVPCPATPAGQKVSQSFSFSSCDGTGAPIICHQVQIEPLTPCRTWWNEIDWVFEPIPELVFNWQTEATDHDLPGYHSMRDAYIAYMGGSGAPSFIITTEYSSITYPLPSVSAGQYVRAYVVLQPQKAKWRSYQVQSCGGMRLFKKDCEVRVKAWGSTGPYISALPFGGPSRADGARI
jgi:hypothetical protein